MECMQGKETELAGKANCIAALNNKLTTEREKHARQY